MSRLLLVALLGLGASMASAQFFDPFAGQTISLAIRPPPLQQAAFQPSFQTEQVARKPRVLAHRAVLINAENEAKLPQELVRSNRFYKDPITAQALAKDSWFGPGEEQVINREADKIPRQQVFKLLRQAGLARRR